VDTQKHDEQALKRIGVDRYLQKPFSIDELVEAVTEPIESHS
jgi:DNA-binding response OmpR family regulator